MAVSTQQPGSAAVRNEAESAAPAEVAFSADEGSQSQPADLAVDSDSLASVRPVLTRVAGAAMPGSGLDAPEFMPGARLAGDNLISGHQVAFVRDAVNASRGFESRVMPARAPKVDPLAQMAVASRSALLLNAALASASATPAVRSGDRIARRLTTDRFYADTVSRIDAHGNSVGLRF